MSDVSLITIGNELLSGRIVNTNATAAANILRRFGYSLNRVVTISDNKEDILSTLRAELKLSDVVLISGGLGPTKDDITKKTLAEWFNSALVWDSPTLDFLKKRYADRPHALTELTKQQALVPEACIVIPNAKGTAPGMGFPSEGKYVFSMPGVPFEMIHMLEFGIMPVVEKAFSTHAFISKTIRVTDIPESVAAKRMETIEDELPPQLSISYLPREDGLWLEMSLRTPREEMQVAEQLLDEGESKIFKLFEDKVYAKGDLSLGQLLGEVCKEKKLSVAVVESLTGGTLAAKIVSISGSSSYFKGSVTAYAIPVKVNLIGVDQHIIDVEGVVSEAVAKAMANGVRNLLKSDIAISTTGYAEADESNKAQAWIGYADAKGSEARWVSLRHDRSVNINRAANYALQWCLKKVKERFE